MSRIRWHKMHQICCIILLRDKLQFMPDIGYAQHFHSILIYFQHYHVPLSSDTQTERKGRVANVCARRQPELSKVKMLGFKKKLALCRAYKCATTASICTITKLMGCTDCWCRYSNKTWVHGLGQRPQKIQSNMAETFSFFFVREPYMRFFSTYTNKFYLPKEHWAPIGPEVAKRYRLNPTNNSLQYGHDITFHELIRYVVDEYEQGNELDGHLRPIHQLCDPCQYNYSFIGKLETLHEDWRSMFKTWKDEGIFQPSVNLSETHIFDEYSLSEVKHLYAVLDRLKHSDIPAYSLYIRTWHYYQVKGKISKYVNMPFTREEIGHYLNNKTFTDAIETAILRSKSLPEVHKQKQEALIQAYSTVPRSLLERLWNVVKVDCELFGYEDRPSWLFDDTHTRVEEFEYFKFD